MYLLALSRLGGLDDGVVMDINLMRSFTKDHKPQQVMSPASVTRSNDQTANAYTAMANIEPRATAKQGGKGGEG